MPPGTARCAPASLCVGLLGLLGLMALAGPARAGAQAVEGPLTPAGRLRVQVAPLFWTHDHRFGRHVEDGRVVDEEEPLGFDLTRQAAGTELLPALGELQDALGDAQTNPGFRVSLGRTRARIQATRITLPLRADVGVTEWLTVGVTAPLVRTRSEVAFLLDADSSTANLGLNPRLERPSQVDSFQEAIGAAIEELEARADARCDGRDATAVECGEMDAALDQARSLRDALSRAYGSGGLFPFGASTAGRILVGRLETLRARFSDHGVDGFPETLPLADGPLTPEQLDAYLSDPAFGIAGDTLDTWRSPWRLGDVELHGALRLLEKSEPADSGSVFDRATWLVGAGGLVRFGTGRPDAADRFTDLGSGDGQTDVELRAFGDVAWARTLGLWADLRYGVQMEGERVRRVAPPEAVLAPASLTRRVSWTPGNYLSAEVAPRYHLTPELAVAARYRYYRKAEDAYGLLPTDDTGPDELPPVDPSVLELETEETLQQLGVGLVFSTLRRSEAGLAGRPVEVHARYRTTLAGSGGLAPRASSFRVGLRLFWRLWGE